MVLQAGLTLGPLCLAVSSVASGQGERREPASSGAFSYGLYPHDLI